MESRAEAGVLREEKRLDHERITQLQDHLKMLEQVCMWWLICMYVRVCVCVCVCVYAYVSVYILTHAETHTHTHTHQLKTLEQLTVNELPIEITVTGGAETGHQDLMSVESGAGSESVRETNGRENRQSMGWARGPGDAVGGWKGGRDAMADSDAAAGGEQEEEEERRKKERKLVAALAALEEEVQALRKERGTKSQKSVAWWLYIHIKCTRALTFQNSCQAHIVPT